MRKGYGMLEQNIQQRMDNYWNDRAKTYGEQNRGQLKNQLRNRWKQLILKMAPKNRSLNILDIGTGPGFFAILMAEEGHQVTAIDMNGNMLIEAKKNAKGYETQIQFLQVGETLPFQDESFDLVISRDVTWTLPFPENTMKHWFSKVKSGGWMLYFDANWYAYLKDEQEYKAYKRYRQYVEANDGFTYEKFDELEKIAYELPMTYRKRPEWDFEFWSNEGITNIVCQENLNNEIYTLKEQLQYAKQPEFLVYIQK